MGDTSMTVTTLENIRESCGVAVKNTIFSIPRWIALTIFTCIPIINFIASGVFLKIYRKEEPAITEVGKCFIQGLLSTIITLIYSIIPTIIIIIILLCGMNAESMIVVLADCLLTLLIGFITAPAIINFARKQSFGGAFRFGEIIGMIGKLGLGRYILAWITVIILCIPVLIVWVVFSMIPVLGLGLILLTFPMMEFFAAKYFDNLFE